MASSHLTLPITLGRYHLQAEVASGGVATVYIGRMVAKAGFERRVAVKVLHKHLSSDPEFVAMFLDEARLSARIHHQNVVGVYDVDAIDGELIMAMEYVEGAPLSFLNRVMRRQGGALDPGLALRIAHDTLSGLHAAHMLTGDGGAPLGLVHRDVSPQNILVGVDGITRVADFGIAKAAGRIASTQDKNTVKGKLRYLSPEQIHRGGVDRRTDVFAAGIVLWETLAGQSLFQGDTDAEVIGQLLNQPIEAPSHFRPGISPEIDAVCLRALDRKLETRFQSAEEFADAIEECVPRLPKHREVGTIVGQAAQASIKRGRDAMQSIAELPANAVQASAALFAQTGTGSGASGTPSVTTTTGQSTGKTLAEASPAASRRGALIGGAVAFVGLLAVGGWYVSTSGPAVESQPSAASTAPEAPPTAALPSATVASEDPPSAPSASAAASAEPSASATASPSAEAPASGAKAKNPGNPSGQRPGKPSGKRPGKGAWVPLQP